MVSIARCAQNIIIIIIRSMRYMCTQVLSTKLLRVFSKCDIHVALESVCGHKLFKTTKLLSLRVMDSIKSTQDISLYYTCMTSLSPQLIVGDHQGNLSRGCKNTSHAVYSGKATCNCYKISDKPP